MKRFKNSFTEILVAVSLCIALCGCSAGAGIARAAGSAISDGLAFVIERYGDDGSEVADTVADGTSGKEISEVTENQIPRTSSTITAGGADPASLPVSYDSRDAGKVPPVRDQHNLGTCWAFASLSAIESRLLPGEVWDFSEDNMSHDPYFRLGQTGGGEYTMAMAYLLSWRGPVTEDQDPYGDQISPTGLSPVKHVQEVLLLPDDDPDSVKRAVMEYGSVETSVYMDLQYVNERSEFYNPDTAAYCCPLPMTPNHDITIIGWDDNFPKEAFTQPVSRDGAFICENNWGTEFGRDGFFYVSYEDRTIGSDNVVYSVVDPVTNYSDIYQCDACGWIGQMGYSEESAWGANVYRTDKATRLSAAGFYAIDRNTSYEIYVARDIPENPTDADLDEREKVAEGTLSYAGFYTIPFDREISLNAGERFAIMIHITTPGAVHPIAIEYDAGDGKCVVVLDGESYASYNGKNWEHTQLTQECDICLKAYSR